MGGAGTSSFAPPPHLMGRMYLEAPYHHQAAPPQQCHSAPPRLPVPLAPLAAIVNPTMSATLAQIMSKLTEVKTRFHKLEHSRPTHVETPQDQRKGKRAKFTYQLPSQSMANP